MEIRSPKKKKEKRKEKFWGPHLQLLCLACIFEPPNLL
jgi:hypothetical protein